MIELREYIAKDACSLIGNTPMVYLNNVCAGSKAKIGIKFLNFMFYLNYNLI